MTRQSYDAASILGLGEVSSDPLPDPAPGEVVIRVGAWSLLDLNALLPKQPWYREFPCSSTKLIPGVYRVRFPVLDSNNKSFGEQKKLLLPDEEVAPVALAVTVALCQLKQGCYTLHEDWCRCAEELPNQTRMAIHAFFGTKTLLGADSSFETESHDRVWICGARKS